MIVRKLFAPLAVIFVSIVAAIALATSSPPLPLAEARFGFPYVRVVDVRPGPVDMVVESQGTVSPRSVASLTSQVSGTVVWTSASLVAGGHFEAGEPMLRIDSRDYRIEADRARAAVDRAEAEHQFTRFELRRLQELKERQVISRAALEAGVRAARVADAALADARAALERAALDVARTEVRAPFDGMVRAKQVDTGHFVSRGATIATLYAVDYVEVRLPVADRQFAWLDLPRERRGELDPATAPPVAFTAEYAGRQRLWKGRVVRTEAEIDARSRMVYVVARIDARNSDAGGQDRLLPPPFGLFVHAEILGRSFDNIVVLPRSAVRNGNQVLVVDAGDRLRFRPVQVVRISDDDAYIGAGLDAGERVCISAVQAVVDGMPVRIADDAQGYGSRE